MRRYFSVAILPLLLTACGGYGAARAGSAQVTCWSLGQFV